MSNSTLEGNRAPHVSRRYRSPVARGLSDGPARDPDRIDGVAVITRGMARGHGVEIDDVTLGQVIELGNDRAQGIKSRFGHPNMSTDAIGTYLGRARNFRLDGDVVRADLEFDPSAHETPSGDLAEYILSLAESDPDAFGASIAFRGEQELRRDADGMPTKGDDGKNLPPLIRVRELFAVDVVDTPAANEGLFSGSPVAFSAELTDFLNQMLENPDAVERLGSFLDRYRANRGEPAPGANQQEAHMERNDTDGAAPNGEATYSKADLDAAVSAALSRHAAQVEAARKAERSRVSSIRRLGRQMAVDAEAIDRAIEEELEFSAAAELFGGLLEEKRAASLAELSADPAAGVSATAPETDFASEPFDERAAEFDEARWSEEFDRNAELRSQWSGSKDAFLAYGRNRSAVKMNIEE